MILMADASQPPPRMPDGYKVMAGYIGGDTPHVWTSREWDRFNGYKKLPIFTRSNPERNDPHIDAFAALERLYSLGVPKKTYVAWDLESAVNPSYLKSVRGVINWAGYKLLIYGQASTIFNNPTGDGIWVAEWHTDKQPFKYADARARITQYTDGPEYDSNVVNWWTYTYRLKKW